MKDCLAISFLLWKQMISLNGDDPVYTYTHPHTRRFIKEACYGRRVGANIRDFEPSANTTILNALRSLSLGLKLPRDCETLSTSTTDGICNFLQEDKTYIDV